MKKLHLAPFDCNIFIYRNDEKQRFIKDYDAVVSATDYGAQKGNGVWLGEYKDLVGVCYHEAVHLADWVIEQRLCMDQGTLESNTELRAYLTEYIGNAVRKYVCGS